MCGIAGIVRFDGKQVDRACLQSMIAAMSHRGPDDEGLFIEAGVGLGVRRLAIIDLSPTGHQPMMDGDGLVEVVFNGEIYNFKDLRSRLSASGYVFRGSSDTEVLVHGYRQFGAAGLAIRLEGMFAFAVLDRKERKLFLARDHFGVKPLYLRQGSHHLSFSSEIRPLAFDGCGAPSVDPRFVGSFLRLGYVPSPTTAFRGIAKLMPGTVLEIELDSGVTRPHRYYELSPAPPDAIEDDDALLQQLREALNLAVRRQLVADVPVGIFLSGGIDSSTLSALAARHSTQRLRSFTIGFARSDRKDETAYATEVAHRVGCENIAIHLAPDALHDLEAIVNSLEEPLADSAVLPLWHLCKGTAAHVKVALSGEGGDEAFGGYARYFWGPVANRLAHSPSMFASAIRGVASTMPTRAHGWLNVVRRAGKLAQSIGLRESERYLSWFDIFSSTERAALQPDATDMSGERIESLFRRARELGFDEIQRLQFVDIGTFLLDNLLMKSDKLSMAHSLEVRVPLLDRPLVELALGLPKRAKIVAATSKVLLRRFVRAELPETIARRAKRGFEIPVDRWFREEATADLRNGLSRGVLVRSLGFCRNGIDALVGRHMQGEDLGRQLFSLLTLDLWARRYCS
jgi:asparagine synthase (glutamine-hydrolysing)